MITTMVATTRVAFTGAVNKLMTFGLKNSEYVIKRIDGLGPVNADIISSENANGPGNKFLSARDTQRNIVITMGFAPKRGLTSTVESLRRELKSVFMPKSKVELLFADDVLGQWVIIGRVESHEPDIFSKDPEVQISLLCDDPYFYKYGAADIEFMVPPLTNSNERFVLDYQSDVPTGFVFETDIVFSSVTAVELRLEPEPGLIRPFMRVDMDYNANDHLRISSVRYKRGATYYRGTTTPNTAMGGFSGSLISMELQPGLNYLTLFGYQGVGVNVANINGSKITYPQLLGGF